MVVHRCHWCATDVRSQEDLNTTSWFSYNYWTKIKHKCKSLWFCQGATCHSHWLPVKQHCAYKALLFCQRIAYRDLFVPSYFSCVCVKQCVRSTRQSGTLIESSYRPNLVTAGYTCRSFEAYAPSLWNALHKVIHCIDNIIGTFKKTPKNTSI